MLKKIVLVFAVLALAKAQLPSLGWCPEYIPMPNFDMSKFLGVWYEAERYFQLSDLVSRCVTANYTRGLDGKVRVSNEVTNRFTGVKRVLDGEIKPAASKSEEGKLHVKYTTVPLTPETQYSVLDTDYKSYAVLWSCSGIGPVHAQNAWLMTRERVAPGETMQKAYGVLDKYNIWRRYFVKTEQSDCAYEIPKPEAEAAPAPAPAPVPAPAPAAEAAQPVKESAPAERKSGEAVHLRSAAVQPEVEAVDETRNEQPAVLADAPAEASIPVVSGDEVRVASPEPVAEAKPAAAEAKPQEVEFKPIAPETIPEVILKVAESAKEASASPIAEESKTVQVIVPAESKPEIEAPLAAKPAEAEEPKVVEATVQESKPETAPIEEAKPTEAHIKLAEEPKPVELPAAAEEAKPLEPLSPAAEIEKPSKESEKIDTPQAAVLLETLPMKSAEGIVPAEAAEEVKVAEAPAAVPETPLVKTLPVSEIKESAEPAKIPEASEMLLKKEPSMAVPETILDPVVPVAPVAAVQSLKKSEVAPEKAEVIAEVPKVRESKP